MADVELPRDLLRIRNLVVEARSESSTLNAVDHVDLDIGFADTVGIVGESGSGKTTLIRSVLDLLERNVRITQGSVEFDGSVVFDMASGVSRLASIRGSQVGMIFQTPRMSLNPLMSIGRQLSEVLSYHRPNLKQSEIRSRSEEVLAEMDLNAQSVMSSYPHQLSGGMCQRAAIALAIANVPRLLIADECTSALDVTTQEEVIKLIQKLVKVHQMALIFVTHDILLASELCEKIIVMNRGQVVESGPTARVLANPCEEYTKQLIAAVPRWQMTVL